MIRQAQPYRPARAIDAIADFIGDPVEAAQFPSHIVRFRNDRAATEVGLAALDDAAWIAHFGAFTPLPGSLPQPLALRYHGHQFRVYNPDIGDGRGFLFAQLHDDRGRLMDLGTKGSGQTPYSRFGDGRLTLKGAVREILATEMLEALGVETSRTFSVIETGEALHRGDEPSPTRSAVLVRLNHGHIRIGSFQRLATLGLEDELRRLVDYALRTYFDNTSGDPVVLLRHVAERTARLAASYMAAGFVHGVLNSDNINITGESFDYGPWRFTPTFDATFTAAYFDHAGLYAFGRQAEAIHWDVVQLGAALRPLADTDALVQAIDAFGPAYRAALVDRFLWRLGVTPHGDERDVALVQAIEARLTESGEPIDAFFFANAGGRGGSDAVPALVDYTPTIDLGHPYWQRAEPCAMLIEEVEAIWQPIAQDDDWSMFNAKLTLIRQMGEALAMRHVRP
ncbi:MAG: protein adenylyltransferase SelO family protein [Sphingomonadaceae bacterium]